MMVSATIRDVSPQMYDARAKSVYIIPQRMNAEWDGFMLRVHTTATANYAGSTRCMKKENGTIRDLIIDC